MFFSFFSSCHFLIFLLSPASVIALSPQFAQHILLIYDHYSAENFFMAFNISAFALSRGHGNSRDFPPLTFHSIFVGVLSCVQERSQRLLETFLYSLFFHNHNFRLLCCVTFHWQCKLILFHLTKFNFPSLFLWPCAIDEDQLTRLWRWKASLSGTSWTKSNWKVFACCQRMSKHAKKLQRFIFEHFSAFGWCPNARDDDIKIAKFHFTLSSDCLSTLRWINVFMDGWGYYHYLY